MPTLPCFCVAVCDTILLGANTLRRFGERRAFGTTKTYVSWTMPSKR